MDPVFTLQWPEFVVAHRLQQRLPKKDGYSMYAPDQGRTKRVTAKWYRDCTLLFTRDEMRQFMTSCRTVGGKPDQMFGFGFDDPTAVFLTRGDPKRSLKDYSKYLLDSRIPLLREALNA